MPTFPCSGKTERDTACMYVHTSLYTYPDRHVLGLLLCAGGIAPLCCAVLCCSRGWTTYILVHTKTAKCLRICMLVLTNSVCLLALSGKCERESTAKTGSARHSTGLHDTPPHAEHDAARHRTALRRAAGLAKLNGAGGCSFLLSAIRGWV